MEIQIDEAIGEFIRSYGKKNSTGDYTICLPIFVEVDGRDFAEELEDNKHKTLCTIDYIGISSDSTSPWFHMYETKPGAFPLASNDQYNFSAINKKLQEKILKQFKKKYKNVEISEEATVELKRSKWLNWSQNRVSKVFIGIGLSSDDQPHFTNFSHVVDCSYCCHNSSRDKFDDTVPYKSIDEMKQYIIDTCDNYEIALALKIIYPTYEIMFSSAYLAYQSNIRFERWRTIIPYIYDNVDKHVDDELYNQVILTEPPMIVNN